MIYRVIHQIECRYSELAEQAHNEIRLTPLTTARQAVLQTKLSTEPATVEKSERRDAFGNMTSYLNFTLPHNALKLTADSWVQTRAVSLDFNSVAHLNWIDAREQMYQAKDVAPEDLGLAKHSLAAAPQEGLLEYAKQSFQPGRTITEVAQNLNQLIHADFALCAEEVMAESLLATVFQRRQGAPRDMAHMAIVCLRAFGFAAAYVSGYIEAAKPKSKKASRLVGAGGTHAWFAVYVPRLKWVHFDPANNMMIDDRYVQLAMGSDYLDIMPVKGMVYGGGEHQIQTSVEVLQPTDVHFSG